MNFIFRVAVANIQREFPNAKVVLQKKRTFFPGKHGSFNDDLKKIVLTKYVSLPPEERSKTTKDEWDKLQKERWWEYCPPFIPDLYEIDEENGVITLFEVEDSSCLTSIKLQDLIWWADSLEEFTVRLVIADRYGLNLRELPLDLLYVEAFVPDEIAREQSGSDEGKRPMRRSRRHKATINGHLL